MTALCSSSDSADAGGFYDWCEDGQCEAFLGHGGGYGFGRLRPGKYRILATPRTFNGVDDIEEFVKQNRGRGEIIEIKKEGDRISKNLRMLAEGGDDAKK
jgi:hypothetical protein